MLIKYYVCTTVLEDKSPVSTRFKSTQPLEGVKRFLDFVGFDDKVKEIRKGRYLAMERLSQKSPAIEIY